LVQGWQQDFWKEFRHLLQKNHMVISLREIIFFPLATEVDLFDCNKTAPVLFTGYQAALVSSSVRNDLWSNGRNIPSQHIVQHCWHLLRLVAFNTLRQL
jgi:hypothetical protein